MQDLGEVAEKPDLAPSLRQRARQVMEESDASKEAPILEIDGSEADEP